MQWWLVIDSKPLKELDLPADLSESQQWAAAFEECKRLDISPQGARLIGVVK